jgi:hypothetical protein
MTPYKKNYPQKIQTSLRAISFIWNMSWYNESLTKYERKQVQNIVKDVSMIIKKIVGTHVERIQRNRLLKLALCYNPIGKINRGCPRKRQM